MIKKITTPYSENSSIEVLTSKTIIVVTEKTIKNIKLSLEKKLKNINKRVPKKIT